MWSYLPNFFGVVTLNPIIFYFAILNMRSTLKKMTELTYAELIQGRESTRLPHTHVEKCSYFCSA